MEGVLLKNSQGVLNNLVETKFQKNQRNQVGRRKKKEKTRTAIFRFVIALNQQPHRAQVSSDYGGEWRASRWFRGSLPPYATAQARQAAGPIPRRTDWPDVSILYGARDATCPVSTGGEGAGGGQSPRSARTPGPQRKQKIYSPRRPARRARASPAVPRLTHGDQSRVERSPPPY